MAENPEHEKLVEELRAQLTEVFINSDQGIYLYLDDVHKTCNDRFAQMLGYSSVDEWNANEFPLSDVAEQDQAKTVEAYRLATEKFHATTLVITMVSRSGERIPVSMIMIPISFKGEIFAMHFLSIIS